MDKRNSKEKMLNKINELESKLQEVFDAGEWGISHVGAGIQGRQIEAEKKLHIAMYGEYIN